LDLFDLATDSVEVQWMVPSNPFTVLRLRYLAGWKDWCDLCKVGLKGSNGLNGMRVISLDAVGDDRLPHVNQVFEVVDVGLFNVGIKYKGVVGKEDIVISVED
jgi:hypothetical protein